MNHVSTLSSQILCSRMLNQDVRTFGTKLNEGLEAPFVLSEDVKGSVTQGTSLIFELVDRSVSELLIGNSGRVGNTAACT
jgi:hypothetical protein